MKEGERQTPAQRETIFTNAEARIDAARRNLAWNITDKIRSRAKALGDENFPVETVRMGEASQDVKLITIGPFRKSMNHEAYINTDGEVFVARLTTHNSQDFLDLNTAIRLHDWPDYTEQDVLDLDAQATFALRQVLESIVE
jgi:hypothetical protein